MKTILFLGAMLAAGPFTALRAQHFASGPARAALVELYTSEGCSSCPPAERWLATLRDEPRLWTDFVPVEFHVNYWDRLGWPDRFATREFTQREYDYSSAWGAGSVYTPCAVRNGLEWRAGQDPRGQGGAAGVLAITLGPDGTCRVEFAPAGNAGAGRKPFEVHIAWLGGGVASRVTAGENRGETLRHEFVALSLARHDLEPAGAVLRAEFAAARPADNSAPRLAVAAWVTHRGELVPVQATGGWIKP
jgi:hypothetical protein